MPNAAVALTATLDNRRKARYVAACLLVNMASGGVTPSLPPFESTVITTLPIKEKAYGTRVFPSHVSVDMISDTRALGTHLTNAAGGTVPHMLRMEDKSGDLYIMNDIDGLRRKFNKWVKGLQFLLLVPCLKNSFIRHLLQTTLHNSLQQCKQMRYNVSSRTFVTVREDQFHENFIIRMNTLSDVN